MFREDDGNVNEAATKQRGGSVRRAARLEIPSHPIPPSRLDLPLRPTSRMTGAEKYSSRPSCFTGIFSRRTLWRDIECVAVFRRSSQRLESDAIAGMEDVKKAAER